MNLHEYQAKALFKRFNIPVPEGHLARTPEEVRERTQSMAGDRYVIKAQVHAGARGKAGGVKLVDGADEAVSVAKGLLGTRLRTIQTGPEGLPVNSVYVEEPSAISRELYLSMLVDRGSDSVAIMVSPDGGMNIEEVAENTPERILTLYVHPGGGLQGYHIRELGFFLGLDKSQLGDFGKIIKGLYRIFSECDASLVEINPLIVTETGALLPLDGKLNIDDNALFRQPEIAEQRDETQEDEAEREAAKHDLNYITLDGNIGCMVNGAGLAMATMDLIKLHGGQPANFLDVGGGTTAERVAEAFKLITSAGDVKAILVNIFGGIVRCDLIAEGIVAAVKEVGLTIPVVARLEGTNVDRGREILAESGFNITPATDLTEAAKTVVRMAGGAA